MAATAESVKEPPQSRTGPAFIEDLPIASIVIGRNVRDVDPKDLEELRHSIEQQGVLEPVLVSMGKPGKPGDLVYTLVAGFRRVAAAKLAKLKSVPARVFELAPEEITEIQLTENLQREDLSELEEARAYKDYVDAGHSQADLAKKIGKSQPYVANRIRLLGFPEPVQKLVDSGKLTASHAEVLLKLPAEGTKSIVTAAAYAVETRGSVRDLENEVGRKLDSNRRARQDRADFEKTVKAAKFKLCPKCKSPASKMDRWSSSSSNGRALRCKEGHEWWSLTGQATGSGYGRTERKVPTLEEVPVEIESSATPDSLWAIVGPLVQLNRPPARERWVLLR